MKKPAQFRIEFVCRAYPQGPRWTWRVVSCANGKNILSSTGQLFSRRVDAHRIAQRFLRSAKEGRVELDAKK